MGQKSAMRLDLCGKRWQLIFVTRLGEGNGHDGSCDSPNVKNKAIRIKVDLHGRRRLEVFIHEMLHACSWNLDESFVDRLAHDISHALWRLGYRDMNKCKKRKSANRDKKKWANK